MRRREFLTAVSLCPMIGRAQSNTSREAFLKFIDRPKVPLGAATKLVAEDAGAEQNHFTYSTESSQRVPGIMVKPKSAASRMPVVVALHGTGGTKEGQLPLLKQLAGKGFLAIAVDGRYHGERSKQGKGSADYSEAMLRVYRGAKERPFLYDTVWDILRLLDWLESRPDVDASRIGMIGFSKGGMELYLAAAVDARIRASVPCIGVQSFRWALDNNAWQSRVGTFQAAVNAAAKDEGISNIDANFIRKFYDRVAPGVYSDFDGPCMVPLIAARPLLAINGDSDARTPLPGLMHCINAAKEAYAGANAEDRFQFLLQEKTGHRVNPESLNTAIAWFGRWLGEPRNAA